MKLRKLLVVLLAFSLIFAVGCGNKSGSQTTEKKEVTPEEVTTMFLDGVKEKDEKKVAKVYSKEKFDVFTAMGQIDEEDDDPIVTKITQKVLKNVLKFDYKIKDTKIDGDKAKVNVEFTTYAYGSALTAFAKKYTKKVVPKYMAGASETEMMNLAEEMLTEQFSEVKKNYTAATDISLTKKDGEWKVDAIADDSKLVNILLGNLNKSLDKLEDMAQDMVQELSGYDEG